MKRVCDTNFRGAQVCDGDEYIVYGLSKRPLEVMAVCTSARATNGAYPRIMQRDRKGK